MAPLPENAQTSVIRDTDPQETREWQDALAGVIDKEGADRAHFLIQGMIAQAREEGIDIPYSATTEYVNTIPADRQPRYPGNATIEIRIRNFIRWNAMAMVVHANRCTNHHASTRSC
jgi:pyruvate dehydrogenase E1 component